MLVGSYVGPVKLSRAEFRGSYGIQIKSSIFIGTTDTNEGKAFYLEQIHTQPWKWQCELDLSWYIY